MKARLRRTAAIYGARASDYLRYWAPALAELAQPLVDRLPAQLGVLVDIGCGVGTIATSLQPRARRVIGLDLTEGMLRESKGLRAVVADAEHAPLREACADTAMSTFALQHIPRPGAVYAEAARILKRGGVFATAT